ncbi:helix-turn-helix domain-containing protein [Methylobacterium sp. J-048]|uniref:helix-turn-helix transcriptional regulator n=1 Tax=Methylobacterium sp. J-048 TaxID=2836635 RepID=UPI001FBA7BBC|nr:helix-turn-helix domain-containing protein [Methylobacterium sp. J-048]MCJ2056839.1 helix-turn-helix domain-containing protein [Methylobacterium sp. J-048]
MNYTVQGAAGEPRAPTGKLLHRTKDAQQILSISNSTFYRLVAAGKLKVVRIGASSYVPDESIRTFLTSLVQEAA